MFHYITTKEQLRTLLPTTADVVVELLHGDFYQAEVQLLLPWLGQPTLDQLHAANPGPVVAHALELIAPAIASYGYRLYVAAGQLVLGQNGARRPSTEHQKPLNPTELANLVAELERKAYAQLDEVLVHLEENPQVFEAWHAGRFSTVARSGFFRTADTMDHYLVGDVTRCRFKRLWPMLASAQLRYIRPLLGRQLLERLNEEQEMVEHSELVDLVRTAIAGLTQDDDVAQQAAHQALEEIRFLLHESLEQYPEFEESPAYNPPQRPMEQPNAFYGGF